jgi:hypothetical protein
LVSLDEHLAEPRAIRFRQYHFSIELVVDEHANLIASIRESDFALSFDLALHINSLAVTSINAIVSAKTFISVIAEVSPVSVTACHSQFAKTMTLIFYEISNIYLFCTTSNPSSSSSDIIFIDVPPFEQLPISFEDLDSFAENSGWIVFLDFSIIDESFVFNDMEFVCCIFTDSKLLFTEIIERLLLEKMNRFSPTNRYLSGDLK